MKIVAINRLPTSLAMAMTFILYMKVLNMSFSRVRVLRGVLA